MSQHQAFSCAAPATAPVQCRASVSTNGASTQPTWWCASRAIGCAIGAWLRTSSIGCSQACGQYIDLVGSNLGAPAGLELVGSTATRLRLPRYSLSSPGSSKSSARIGSSKKGERGTLFSEKKNPVELSPP